MLLLLLACRTQDVEIFIANEDADALSRFVELLVDDRVRLTISESPHKSAQRAEGQGISVTADTAIANEAFRLSFDGAWRVESGDLLGRQYGLAELLEQAGYRFNHPYRTLLPEQLLLPQSVPNQGEIQAPEMTRRGIHLHTLHPIEGYYDVWEPSSESAQRAHRITDWLIKNKGNYLQWVALDDISENAIRLERWQDHNQLILAEMKMRGIQTGIGVQLHGSGNLQQAFDLIDDPVGDAALQVQERLEMIMSGGDFDLVELSFGEFFGEDPQLFIDQINLAAETMWRERPDLELAARLHVGADLMVTYEDRELIYYFLAAYANPAIVPWVHTVMYYNLFDPTNGAYHHTEFDVHREFLVDRLRTEQPVVYFPESAYWVAFDNSVPTYLPLYIHSRWLDLAELRAHSLIGDAPSLQQHVLFSSGWEWGYWQNDVATLKMNWALPESPEILLREMFGNYVNGALVATQVAELAILQREWLILRGLDAYYCGVDNIMELGYSQGIIAQAPRPSFRDLYAMTADALETELAPLQEFELAMERVWENVFDPVDEWQQEIVDGIEIDLYRIRFMRQLLSAIRVAQESGDVTQALTAAERTLTQARSVTTRRQMLFHDPNPMRLVEAGSNATIYQYGYLIRAEQLCYWERELQQTRNLLLEESESVPGCGI